jgi:hypothetical protein
MRAQAAVRLMLRDRLHRPRVETVPTVGEWSLAGVPDVAEAVALKRAAVMTDRRSQCRIVAERGR